MTDNNEQSAELQAILSTFDGLKQAIVENKAEIQAYKKKYLKKTNPDAEWIDAGGIQNYKQNERIVILHLSNAIVRLEWINPQTLHVRINPGGSDIPPYFSYFVQDDMTLDEQIPVIQDNAKTITVKIADFSYVIDKATFSIHCLKDETLIWENALFSWTEDQESAGLSVNLQADEASFGTGERAFELNLRGRELPIWNRDPGGYERGDDPINANVPFYAGVHGSVAYGVLWDASSFATFDIGASNSNQLRITGETDAISCYFFAGNRVEDVLFHYSNVTGWMKMPPLWALGYQQSRYSYLSQEEVLRVAAELRERDTPCDVIYLDIHYMDGYRIFTWDKKNFPDMKGMIDKLHAMGMKLIPILDPGIKVDDGYIGYESGKENDVFVKYPDGEYASGVVWPGLCHFPDFSSADVRQWWVEHLADLMETGVDGLWNDMNEPLIFDDEAGPQDLPSFVQHDKEGMGATHGEIHNVYGTLMAQASLAALEKHRPGKRQFNFIRACTAGTQRYASSWTGDNHSEWDDLHLAITTTLQMGLSGIAFTGADVGGFMRDTDGELLTRWTQAGAFMPFFRNHSAVDTIYQEPWRFGQPYEDAIRDVIQLRYRLMPYLYTAFAQNAFYGTPIVRPIFMAEPENPNIRDIDDSFMVGDNMLVAPILKPGSLRRTVYLPDGDWYELNTNQRYHGGNVVSVEAPLERIPIFVKSGTVMPMWDDLQHLSEPDIKTLKLRVYTDTGETMLYEDAGEGLDYQKGDYRWVKYVAVENTDSLTLTRTVEGDYTPTYKEIELQLVGSRSEITRIDVDGITHFNVEERNGMYVITVDADFNEVHFRA